MSLAPRDILTTITPLRLIFWGCLLCLIDVHSNWYLDGEVWKIDIVSDVIGALLIVWGVFRLSMLRVSGWYSAAMCFVLMVAGLAVPIALHDHFVYDQPQWISGALQLAPVVSLIATVVFCMAMRRLCAAAGLAKSERSWKTTTLLIACINLIPLGLFYAAGAIATLRGETPAFQMPPSIALALIVLVIPVVHFFLSSSRMAREAESAANVAEHRATMNIDASAT
jgi:hypothetical protein